MKKFALISLLGIGFVLSMGACSDDEKDGPDPVTEPDPEAVVVLTATDGGFLRSDGTTLLTGMPIPEKAGLFAVKGGEIVASNIRLNNDGTAYRSDVAINSAADKYFVYFPYDETAATKVVAEATDAASFFQPMTEALATPATDQTDYLTAVSRGDLRYAQATLQPQAAEGKMALDATISHSIAAFTWNLPGGTTYTTADGFKYSTPTSAAQGDVKVNGITVKPANVSGQTAFFYRPGSVQTITIAYTDTDDSAKSATFDLNGSASTATTQSLGAGTIDGGMRQLRIGDIYYYSGAIMPQEEIASYTTLPKGVAGIVVCVDPSRFSDAEKALLGTVHGLIVSAKSPTYKNTRYLNWNDGYFVGVGDVNGRTDDSVEDAAFPGMTLPVLQHTTSEEESYAVNQADINGYVYTKAIMTRRKADMAKGAYQAFNAIEAFNTSKPLPASTTGWYMPSVGQMLDVMRGLTDIDINPSVIVETTGAVIDRRDFGIDPALTTSLTSKLDAKMAKISSTEKDTYTSSDKSIWTSTYVSLIHEYTAEEVKGVRQLLIESDCMVFIGYDQIGKGNVRCVAAF